MNKQVIFLLTLGILFALNSCSVPRAVGPYKEVRSKSSKEATHNSNRSEKIKDVGSTTKNLEKDFHTANSKEDVEKKPEVATTQMIRKESFKLDNTNDAQRLSIYNVIIGSFSKKQNAINLQNSMMPDYNPIIVVNERGMFRVILISYKTYEEARVKVLEIKNQFSDAWILVRQE